MIFIETFFLTLLVSGIFAMGGVGSSVALIPMLSFIGLGFEVAKTIGLFVNTATTSTATFLNIRKGLLNIRFTIPFLLMSIIFAPIGTYTSKSIPIYYIKLFFAIFLLYSAYSMIFKKRKISSNGLKHLWIMYPAGVIVGFMSGLLGIGGGALIIPMLDYMGLGPKEISINVSFMVPFSTFIAFLSHIFVVKIDLLLFCVATIAAILGGISGNRMMHRMDPAHMRVFLGIILAVLAIKLLTSL